MGNGKMREIQCFLQKPSLTHGSLGGNYPNQQSPRQRCHRCQPGQDSSTSSPSARDTHTCSDNPHIQPNRQPTSLSLPRHTSSCLTPKLMERKAAVQRKHRLSGRDSFAWDFYASSASKAATEMKSNSPLELAFLSNSHPRTPLCPFSARWDPRPRGRDGETRRQE